MQNSRFSHQTLIPPSRRSRVGGPEAAPGPCSSPAWVAGGDIRGLGYDVSRCVTYKPGAM